MNGAQFDCSRKSRHAHENTPVPIRVSLEAFRRFQQEMEAYWEKVIAEHGSPRRFRIERRQWQQRSADEAGCRDSE
ncbi:MAG: hypothetical protein WHT09_12130 [Thermogutta sp.]|jgi:hypothetical protein